MVATVRFLSIVLLFLNHLSQLVLLSPLALGFSALEEAASLYMKAEL
jgi:hypothetical protein